MTPPPLPMRGEKPAVVRRAVVLLWLGFALGVAHFCLVRPWNPPHPTPSQTRVLALLPAGAMLGIILSITVLKLGFYGWLIHCMSRGRNWARITRLVLFVVSVAFALSPLLRSEMLRSLRLDPRAGALGIFQYLLVALALGMLFTRGAKPWFEPSPSLSANAMS